MRGAGAAGGRGRTLEFPSHREGKGGHHPGYVDALALGAGDLVGRLEDQLLEFVLALLALVLIDRHGMTPLYGSK
jgi:hypothetical protein